MSDNIQQMIIDLLNQASIYGKDNIRIQHLRHVQELILRKYPNLLEHFLDDILIFQTDKSIEVKKLVISFLEEACHNHPKIILKIIDNLHFLLYDENIFLQKKFILSFISIYKSTLLWLPKSQLIDQNLDHIWRSMTDIKNHIISKLDSDNDGLSIVIIKFMEMMIIILFEYKQDLFVNNQKIFSRNQLEQEEKDMIEKLFQFTLSQHLSNVNLIATIEAITNIARYRSDYLIRVVEIFEFIRNNLPSNLIDSQISNIRKIIKLKLFNLLKHSISSECQPQIRNLLINLGATEGEILKYLPKTFSESKRKLTSNNYKKNTKKSKHISENTNNNLIKKETLSNVHHLNSLSHLQSQTVIDLMEKLSLQNVVDLVLVSMNFLPEKIPPSFLSAYTPIVNAGSPAQIEYLARLLSTQLTAASYERIKSISNKVDVQLDDLLSSPPPDVDNKAFLTLTNEVLLESIPSIQSKKMKLYKLLNAIKPIDSNEIQRMSIDSFHRILDAENICKKSGISHIHKKIINSLVYLSEQSFYDIYKDYIMNDIYQRYDLAFAWIYEEYVHANGYLMIVEGNKKKDLIKYDYLLCQFLQCLQEKNNDLFSHLLTNVPLITDNALVILKQYCEDEEKNNCGMKILYNLIFHRIPIREKCLDILLNLTENENNFLRNNAINMTKKLYEKNQFKQSIERYVLQTLEIGFNAENDCFLLYLSLIPLNHCLIQPLANIYTLVNEDIKQRILRIIEIPIREMGMTSPEILKSIKNCSKGAETLIIHIIHILIEQIPSSNELIENIRDLYYKHIPDVRFLIPILTNLEKYELLSVLPKLIKLPPLVVQEVFNQLLASTHQSPISPSELLIALHQISLDECELKTIINATSLCFNERSIYTNEILAQIIQELIQITPVPLLFMRTVLQTLTLYPKMIHFIMNILHQLIEKQVWKQTRIWEGFIKCCEKTRPYSFPILLQLPPAQLKHVFQVTSDLHDSLRHHLRSMSIDQRSLISSSILTVIEDNAELSSDINFV